MFAVEWSRLANLSAYGNSPVSASYIITGTLGLQSHPAVSMCLWLLRIQTLVLMLVEQACLRMSHLPGSVFRNRKYNVSICSFCLLASWVKITKFRKDHAVVYCGLL